MAGISMFSNPLLLGFDEFEHMLKRASQGAGDGFPPYNIERMDDDSGNLEKLRITLAVAGFSVDDLEISHMGKQLIIKGRQNDAGEREYLHRGIAARQFQRTFVLADDLEVVGASLNNGLLSIDINRVEPERMVRKIAIRAS